MESYVEVVWFDFGSVDVWVGMVMIVVCKGDCDVVVGYVIKVFVIDFVNFIVSVVLVMVEIEVGNYVLVIVWLGQLFESDVLLIFEWVNVFNVFGDVFDWLGCIDDVFFIYWMVKVEFVVVYVD